MDVSKSHAECNVPTFPGVRSRFSGGLYSYKESYSREKACIVKNHKWRSDLCIVYGFCGKTFASQKKKC